jgi:Centromere DNA-binding protein complex CBF3 subunit, domain 2
MTTRLIAARVRSPPPRYSRLSTTTSPGGTVTATVIRHPNELELNSQLEQQVLHLREEYRPDNTQKAQDPKILEYFHYCDVVWDHDPYKYILSCEKVYRFMFYLCFREQKAKGGTKAQRVARSEGNYFDYEEYRRITGAYESGPSMELNAPPNPTKPIGKCTFDAYKAVFKKIYKVQIAKKVLNSNWDQIWQMCFDELYRHVKERMPLMKRLTYAEKVDGEFAPYIIVEHLPSLEDMMWQDSNAVGCRSISAALRHRYCALHLTSGVLRCESLHRAEYSDFLGIRIPKQDTDVHTPYLMINQIAVGKTTHGNKQYGRATRHRDVRLCCVGAFAFYTMFRFHCTGEFSDLSLEDWFDKKKWFHIKILADINGCDRSNEMRNDSYGDHIKSVLSRLKLNCNKVLHLGRNLGAKFLEFLEAEADEIRRMGQWSPSMFDTSYSTKLPMGPIRKLAGFFGLQKIYFNTRTAIIPPQELLVQTPLGAWCYVALDALKEAAPEGKHMTAIQMLRFFCELNSIFIQDAAAMTVLHPEREHHAMFHEMPVFTSEEFKVRSSHR